MVRDYRLSKKMKPYIAELNASFDKEISVISSNCFAGRIVQALNIPYNTPTAGLYFMYPDYIEFLSNLKYYLTAARLEFVNKSKYELGNLRHREQTLKGAWYPIALLDGKVEIHFLHYHNQKEAEEKWYRRAARVNFSKLLVLGFEQNLCSEKDIENFDELDYENKWIFSTRQIRTDSNIYVEEFNGQEEVGNPYLDAPVFFKYFITKIHNLK